MDTLIRRKKICILGIINSYILKEFLKIFLVIAILFSIPFLAMDIYLSVVHILNKSLEASIEFLFCRYIFNLRDIIILSLAYTSAYLTFLLETRNEVLFMLASGIRFLRLTNPIFIMAFLISALNLWLCQNIFPESQYRAFMIMANVDWGNYFSKGFASNVSFRSADSERFWQIKSFDTINELNDVLIKKYTDSHLQMTIQAKKAFYSELSGWRFSDVKGAIIKEHKISKITTTYEEPFFLENLDFHNKLYSKLGTISELPDEMIASRKPDEALTTTDILRGINSEADNQSYLNRLKTELSYKLTYPLLGLFYTIIMTTALSGFLRGKRKINIYHIIAIILFPVIYNVISIMFSGFGKAGIIPPYICGMIPIGVLIICYFVIRKKY